jgi:hypothetical protein
MSETYRCVPTSFGAVYADPAGRDYLVIEDDGDLIADRRIIIHTDYAAELIGAIAAVASDAATDWAAKLPAYPERSIVEQNGGIAGESFTMVKSWKDEEGNDLFEPQLELHGTFRGDAKAIMMLLAQALAILGRAGGPTQEAERL